MTKTTDQILLEAIQDLKNDVARIDRDLAKDREGSDRVAMGLATMQEQISQFSKRLETLQRKIQDKVSDAVAPMLESANDLTNAIDKAKVVKIKEVKKSFWKFWKKG